MISRRSLAAFSTLGGAVALIGALARADLAWRARAAYREGQRRMGWVAQPQSRRAHYERFFSEEKAALDASKASGRIGQAAYLQKLDLARLRLEEAVQASSAAEAYRWLRTAAELSGSSRSRVARGAREAAAQARQIWENELDRMRTPRSALLLE